MPVPGAMGDAYTLTFHAAGQNVASGGQIGARVEFRAQGATVSTANCLIPERGSFNWQQVVCTASAGAAYDSVRISIGWQGVDSGQLGIDAVDLSRD
ncbi:MAG: hypothetical protein ACFB51_13820 [Anaerolineae bacterium]